MSRDALNTKLEQARGAEQAINFLIAAQKWFSFFAEASEGHGNIVHDAEPVRIWHGMKKSQL